MEDLEEVRRNYIATLKPVNPIEDDLVRDMTGHRWRLNRAFLIENNRIDLAVRMGETANKPTGKFHYVLDLMNGPCFKGLQRYQTRLENSFAKAVNTFFKIRDKVCEYQEEEEEMDQEPVTPGPEEKTPNEEPVPPAGTPEPIIKRPPVAWPDPKTPIAPGPISEAPIHKGPKDDDWPKAA